MRVRLIMNRKNYSKLKKALASEPYQASGAWAALDPALRGYLFHFGYLTIEAAGPASMVL